MPAPASVRDLFNSAAYTNNDGTQSWLAAWAETGDSGGATGGSVGVFTDSGSLRLRVQNANRTVTRAANLSAFGTPTLTFLARRNSLDSSAEYVALQISTNGGPFTEIYRFAGPATDASYTNFSFDLTPYISANTQIRFATPGGMAADDQVFIDDIQIVDRRALTARDLFDAASYSNNNGTRNWSTTWIETGDDNAVAAGDVAIVNDNAALRLVVKDDDNSAIRQVNLIGFTSPTLSFQRRRFGLDAAGEFVAVEVSSNGGAFVEIARFAGAATDPAYSFFTYDLTPYISPNTRIRFRTPAGAMDDTEGVFFDDVQIIGSLPPIAQ